MPSYNCLYVIKQRISSFFQTEINMCRASPCGKGNVCEAAGKGAFRCCCAPGLEGPTCEGKSGEPSLNLVQVLFSVKGFTINNYNNVCQLVNAHFLIKSTSNGHTPTCWQRQVPTKPTISQHGILFSYDIERYHNRYIINIHPART